MSLSIHPLFVFDGPNKPPFKRNKRTGPNVASIPEFLAKQLLKQFGMPFHIAPGEAEAECALIQREGIVDAVLSEDVDTLMFGSGITLRNWTPEVNKNGTPTHVNIYDANKTKRGSGLDREGMILIALMSGGDYIPEGIPGCGPKLACEAARAGFGADLCKISRKDKTALKVWRERLSYELGCNESKFFKRKHAALSIPDDFPNPEVLGYYTHPCISPPDKILRLRESLKWDQDLNLPELRTFTAEAFDWTKLGGAKKFIRNLAPALLVRELRSRAQVGDKGLTEDFEATQRREVNLVKCIHGKRNHASTDGITELRVSFTPHNLVPIDLDAEEPDDDIPADSGDEGGDNDREGVGEAPASPSKKRAPPTYDPTELEKLWILETYVKIGVPLKAQDYEESLRNTTVLLAMKHANKKLAKTAKAKKTTTKSTKSGMPKGALDRFTKVTKPGQLLPSTSEKSKTSDTELVPTQARPFPPVTLSKSQMSSFRPPPVSSSADPTQAHEVIDLLSSPMVQLPRRQADVLTLCSLEYDLPSSVTKRRRSPLRRTQTDTAILDLTGSSTHRPSTPSRTLRPIIPDSPTSLPSPSRLLNTKRVRRGTPTKAHTSKSKATSTPRKERMEVLSSPARQAGITDYFSPSKPRLTTSKIVGERGIPPPVFQRVPSVVTESLDLTGSPIRSKPTKPTVSRHQEPLQPSTQESTAPSRQGLFELHSNVVDHQSGQRRPNLSSKNSSQENSSQITKELDLTGDEPSKVPTSSPNPSVTPIPSVMSGPHPESSNSVVQSLNRRSPRAQKPMTGPRTHQLKKKQVIRVRDSLNGAFAIEEIDLSCDTLSARAVVADTARRGEKKYFRVSDIGVLDLTGNG